MLGNLAKKIFGSKIERELKRIAPIIVKINELETGLKALSDTALQAKTTEFRERLAQGATLDDLLPEAFAVVREGSRRILGMRHFDVQLIGGIFLHEGNIAEMKTGEGKTLVATLPVYLNALSGEGVHVVTVNDYLARRDAEWMGRLYNFLGLKVGVIVHGLTDPQRQQSYGADITYGTNNEFGFDYLRDNMKFSLDQYVQRVLNYAIVDEVDSILIDEARTPLIISGSTEDSTDKYYKIDQIIPKLLKGEDYTIDEEHRTAMLTEGGVTKVEKLLGIDNLYDPTNIETLHHVNQGLRAHTLYRLDVDYVTREGKVVIVDEFTGRLMPGRRWSDGLHQAIEAKEKVEIENENQTLATITFQNYFRMYKKLSGMTGTAETEAAEFDKIYNLDVMVVPTHMNMVRVDHDDMVYRTEPEKFRSVVQEIKELHAKGRPVLVGTISIERSELLSTMLKRDGVKHHVLNAKHHEQEAEIVAQAGRFEAVTISTNMAGRGTDILLGGNPEFLAKSKVDPIAEPDRYQEVLAQMRKQCAVEKEKVVAAGGLHVLGTERHEARRIDNQLRGRSGRQGDAGSSRFYISLQDDLMRIFGSDRISNVMGRLGMEEDIPIEHRWISKAIANAQRKVEARNFEIRKNLLEYDDVMNQQRKAVYRLRREILAGNTKDKLFELVDEIIGDLVDRWIPAKGTELDWEPIHGLMMERFDFKPQGREKTFDPPMAEAVGQFLYDEVGKVYEIREKQYGADLIRHVEKALMLQTLDTLWKDHLLNMDHLREGIGLRGYGQKDPLLEYKREGFDLYRQIMEKYAEDVVMKLFRVRIAEEETARSIPLGRTGAKIQLGRGVDPVTPPPPSAVPASISRAPMTGRPPQPQVVTVKRETPKVGRNDPCPCGSGKKYKKCCGAGSSV